MKPGIYDNTRTQQRQKWIESATIGYSIPSGMIDRIHIDEWVKQGLPVEPWGTYPEIPSVQMIQAGRASISKKQSEGRRLTTGRFKTRDELIENVNFMYWDGERSIADCARNSRVSETIASKLIMDRSKWKSWENI